MDTLNYPFASPAPRPNQGETESLIKILQILGAVIGEDGKIKVDVGGGGGPAWGEITGTITDQSDLVSYVAGRISAVPFIIQLACSDNTTALTAVEGVVTFRIPKAMTLVAVKASLKVAQASGDVITIDVKKNGSSIFSTKLTFDNTSKTTVGATTPAVISDTDLTDDSEIIVNIDQVGAATVAAGLTLTLIGTYA